MRGRGFAVLLKHLTVDGNTEARPLRHGDDAAAVAHRLLRELGAQRICAHVVLQQVDGNALCEMGHPLLTQQTALPLDSGGSYRDLAGQGKGPRASPASTMGSTS